LLNRVEMFVKPAPEPILHRGRQLQDKTYKTQGLEDFKVLTHIRDNMRSSATKLFKSQRLPRLISKMGIGLGGGKQLVEAITQDHRH
jgi:hypothetical protein